MPEEITRESRAALSELHTLLGGLNVYSSQPPPAAPDAKTCLRLLREGVRAATSGLTCFGNACGQVSWTTMLCGLRAIGVRDLDRVAPEMASIGERCIQDAGLFGQMQEVVKLLTREIGTKFWAPFGRTMVRRRLSKAAEQKAARKAAEERPSGATGVAAPNAGGGPPQPESTTDNAPGAQV